MHSKFNMASWRRFTRNAQARPYKSRRCKLWRDVAWGLIPSLLSATRPTTAHAKILTVEYFPAILAHGYSVSQRHHCAYLAKAWERFIARWLMAPLYSSLSISVRSPPCGYSLRQRLSLAIYMFELGNSSLPKFRRQWISRKLRAMQSITTENMLTIYQRSYTPRQ